MKKILAVLLLSFGFAQAEAPEFGLGVISDLNGNNIGLAVKHDEYKFEFNGGWAAVDYLFIERSLGSSFNWFMGLGGSTDYNLNNIAARLPIGIDYDFNDSFDIFIEVVLGVSIAPNLGTFGDGVDGGIRIFF